jgi:hypothetical protein
MRIAIRCQHTSVKKQETIYCIKNLRSKIVFSALLAILLLASASVAQTNNGLDGLRAQFLRPPDDSRIMMRWWWFGPSVTKPELQRELEQMKAEGIGGVEIATLYPLAVDDPATGFHNFPYLSDEYIDDLHFVSVEAKKLGMRVDVTLGSGWPFGGPHIPITQAAGQLRIETVEVPSRVHSIPAPDISTGEKFIAAFLVPGSKEDLHFEEAKQISNAIENGRLTISPDWQGANSIVFFISSRTGMMVKRPAFGANGFVLDHYDADAAATHLHAVGDRLMQAFSDQPPYAIFSDSLEDYGSNWTGDLIEQFRQRRGYDITPHLPALVADVGPETAAIRHDWGKTLTELANERFLAPLHAWAREHHTLLRSQTYGFPPVTLSSNTEVDLPEGEGKATFRMWREFSDTRWAASAGHLFNHPVISSETWTWLHSPAFHATPLDMKAEADLHFLQGINQLVGHGWPYSPDEAGEPGWRMYAAGALNAHNPWSFAMSDLTGYLQRVSFLLRQGKPANDVAVLLPNDDVWASFHVNAKTAASVTNAGGFNESGENLSMDESMPVFLKDTLLPQILDAGFNFDFIDADAIDNIGIHYPVLVLPNIERLPLATYKKIEQYAQHGGIVIATRGLPSIALGFRETGNDGKQIEEISQRLFKVNGAAGHFVEDENQLGTALASYLKPDANFSPQAPAVGFIHRKLADGDLYFVANTDNRPHRLQASFRGGASHAEFWDAFTGEISAVEDPAKIDLNLQPYESKLIFFTDTSSAPHHNPKSPPNSKSATIDLATDWKVTFNGLNKTIQMPRLISWADTEDDTLKYYSGLVTYEKEVDLSANMARGKSLVLSFGDGTPVPLPDPLPQFNMRAYLESPVREAAEIYVNGKRAGVVWRPPYSMDLTPYLQAGKNNLRIVVGNTAINSLAGRTLPDYRLLRDRYGNLFTPQGLDNLQPLPSGILGPLQLVVTANSAH